MVECRRTVTALVLLSEPTSCPPIACSGVVTTSAPLCVGCWFLLGASWNHVYVGTLLSFEQSIRSYCSLFVPFVCSSLKPDRMLYVYVWNLNNNGSERVTRNLGYIILPIHLSFPSRPRPLTPSKLPARPSSEWPGAILFSCQRTLRAATLVEAAQLTQWSVQSSKPKRENKYINTSAKIVHVYICVTL